MQEIKKAQAQLAISSLSQHNTAWVQNQIHNATQCEQRGHLMNALGGSAMLVGIAVSIGLGGSISTLGATGILAMGALGLTGLAINKAKESFVFNIHTASGESKFKKVMENLNTLFNKGEYDDVLNIAQKTTRKLGI